MLLDEESLPRTATSRKVGKSKGKGRKASRKEEKDQVRAGFFRPYRKGGGKGKKSGKADSSSASKANIAEEEVEEEEAEDDALLTQEEGRPLQSKIS